MSSQSPSNTSAPTRPLTAAVRSSWNRRRIEEELYQALKRPGRDLVYGAQGVPEGLPASMADKIVDKFPPDGLLIVRAGGPAGLFSAIIGGWPGQRVREECQAVTHEIR